jgi:acyl transferase domain-containing protein/surfactin synthase thioesterase subunit/acyl carrier protein
MAEQYTGNEIAIVGMAGRFPGANDLETFWQNLRAGRESIVQLSDEQLRQAGVAEERLRDPLYVKAAAVLDGVDRFDAAFFGYAPREALLMDPQQRVFLECSWEALEHAGHNPELFKGAIGVYAGAGLNTYLLANLAGDDEVLTALEQVQINNLLQINIGNGVDFMPTRVSYKLNLTGPSHLVQCACSTSLVAVHVACQALLNGECDLALAGGVAINPNLAHGYSYEQGGMASPDGRCRPFAADAQGTIFGSGAGVVVLKRLEDALADNDTIHAVIKGSAINNDGAAKIGYTAPSVDGQAQVIAEALANAQVAAESISYVEAHGTGTALGDPIEIQALTKAYRASTDARQFCGIGSVKSNVGHLDAAAGVTSLIKTVLALKHRELPPSLHAERLNPEIDWERIPFYVNQNLKPWLGDGRPRRAGVSAFGVGGTNAHLILEEAPAPAPSETDRDWHLLPLSARTPAALEQHSAQLAAFLERSRELNLADVAATLQIGRRPQAQRRVIVARDPADAIAALRDPQRRVDGQPPRLSPSVTFMFPGQGAQYLDMGRQLYEHEPVFRATVERCCTLLRPHLGLDLRRTLFPDASATLEQIESASQQLNQTAITQPALFVIEYAMAQLLLAWGVRPAALIGHSVGEVVAATLAGVFTLPDALQLIAARGKLMQSLPPGAMLAVPLPEIELLPLLPASCALAASNGPSMSVVAGPTAAIHALQHELSAQGVSCRALYTSHAFHSPMMQPIVAPFIEEFRRIRLSPPTIPFVSNATGAWITPEQAVDPRYWASQLRQPVRFSEGLETLFQDPGRLLLEVGPSRTLSTLVKRHPARPASLSTLTTLRHPDDQHDDRAFLLTTLGKLWLAGVALDWSAAYGEEQRRRTPLPTYPFERQRYWIEARTRDAAPTRATGQRAEPSDRLYLPTWRQESLPPAAGAAAAQRWLILADPSGVGAALAERLAQAGHTIVTVTPGDEYSRHSASAYTLDPHEQSQYRRLLDELRADERLPDRIVHLWQTPSANVESMFALGYRSLLWLTQALVDAALSEPLEIALVATRLHNISGDEPIAPEQALALGLLRTIPLEHANLRCRSIEIGQPTGAAPSTQQIDQLVAELLAAPEQPIVALRGRRRWIPTFEQTRLDASQPARRALRERGVYLILGELGALGLTLAEYLARAVQARLALAGRTPPDVAATEHLAALGAELFTLEADTSDPAQLRSILAQSEARFGPLHGLIAATPPTSRALASIDADELAKVQRQVRGLATLDELLRERALDVVLLCSDNRALLGGLGQAAAASLASFSDALVQRHADSASAWLSVSWDGLRDAEPPLLGDETERLSAAEAGAALSLIMTHAPGGPLLVSSGDLHARLARAEGAADDERSSDAAPGVSRTELTTGYVAPRSQIEQTIATIWQQALGMAQVGVHDNFFDLGGHSLLTTQIGARLREAFQVELPLKQVFAAPTVAELAELIAAVSPTASAKTSAPGAPRPLPSTSGSAWLSYHQPRPAARLRLFCLPYLGGSASIFRRWPELLPPWIEVCPVQYPGREQRLTETPFTDLLALAETIAEQLAPAFEQPFAIFGHSLGALVGFELARRLRSRGHEPVQLFVAGCQAPERFSADRAPLAIRSLDDLTDDSPLLAAIPAEARHNRELLQMMRPLLEADLAMNAGYIYRPDAPLSCPIAAFAGLNDPLVARRELVGWREHTRSRFQLRVLPGDHFFPRSAIRALLWSIGAALEPQTAEELACSS